MALRKVSASCDKVLVRRCEFCGKDYQFKTYVAAEAIGSSASAAGKQVSESIRYQTDHAIEWCGSLCPHCRRFASVAIARTFPNGLRRDLKDALAKYARDLRRNIILTPIVFVFFAMLTLAVAVIWILEGFGIIQEVIPKGPDAMKWANFWLFLLSLIPSSVAGLVWAYNLALWREFRPKENDLRSFLNNADETSLYDLVVSAYEELQGITEYEIMPTPERCIKYLVGQRSEQAQEQDKVNAHTPSRRSLIGSEETGSTLVHDCGARLRISAENVGKRGKCPRCGKGLIIPAASFDRDPAPSG